MWPLKVSRPLDYFRIEDQTFAGFQHFLTVFIGSVALKHFLPKPIKKLGN